MTNHFVSAALAATLGLTMTTVVVAQDVGAEPNAAGLAIKTIAAKSNAALTVTSPAFRPGADIPFANTQYQGNTFPGLSWTAGPAGTRTYAIIMQDTDGGRPPLGVLHWTMFNIAGTSLPAGMSALPAGASYGPNIRGANQAYMGPRTPAGPGHHYHFQVFALDTTLAGEAGATFDTLSAAMTGHVLASGEVVGIGRVDPAAPPAPARGGGGAGRGPGAPGAPGGAAPPARGG